MNDEEARALTKEATVDSRAGGEDGLPRSTAESAPGLAELLGANERGELYEPGPGTIIARKWELLGLLGEGSFGKVYEARHVALGHKAAIKILAGEKAGPTAKRLFLEEAQLMAGMSSEHLLRASDYGELPDGSPYFVMDLVKGKSLRHWLGGRLALERVVEIGEQVLEGVVEVHRRGVVHGDIKPENVAIGEDDKARLLDFGLARTSAEEPKGLGGTPHYMAPEMLFDGAPATVRTDVYAVATVLYEMLTGRLPRGHLGMDFTKVCEEWKIRRKADPVLMHCKGVPEDLREALETLDELVMEALAPDPKARPSSAVPMLKTFRGLRKHIFPSVVEHPRHASETATSTTKKLPRITPIAVGISLAAVFTAAWYLASTRSKVDRGEEARAGLGVKPTSDRLPTDRLPTPPVGMLYVPGGSFRRGTIDIEKHYDDCRNSYGDQCQRRTFERELQHAELVDVSEFFIDEYEVTNAQLAGFMTELQASGEARIVSGLGLKTAGSRPERALASFTFSDDERFGNQPYRAFLADGDIVKPADGMAAHPAVLVTWDLASRYCRARGKRLPTETEWEYAARGTEGRDYVWGDKAISCSDAAFGRYPLVHNYAYIECGNEEKRPRAVGSSMRDLSWCGAADMGANVSEWVWDAFVDPTIGCPAPGELDDEEASACHVYKGGNWIDPWRFSRLAYRPVARPGFRYASIGFRCAASTREMQ